MLSAWLGSGMYQIYVIDLTPLGSESPPLAQEAWTLSIGPPCLVYVNVSNLKKKETIYQPTCAQLYACAGALAPAHSITKPPCAGACELGALAAQFYSFQ